MKATEDVDFLQHTLVSNILVRLTNELPASLQYHSSQHTHHVLMQALRLAEFDGLDAHDTELLAIAAAFHDAGYLKIPHDNESIGAEMAADAMYSAGIYTENDIATVNDMILSTALLRVRNDFYRTPANHLARYLLDADLSVFGQEDFFLQAEYLRSELGIDRDRFLQLTLEMFEGHCWFTRPAASLYESQKMLNLRLLQVLCSSMGSSE